MQNRRSYLPGAHYFFTAVMHDRRPLLIEEMERLRGAFRRMKQRHPFTLEAIVVLPDHLHTMWLLPEGDADYSTRWTVLKRMFSVGLRPKSETISHLRKREKGIWQRRFWEHAIRDEDDWRMHLDYIHYNPVKHGYCSAPGEWPYSSFKKMAALGWYPDDWDGPGPLEIDVMFALPGMEGTDRP